MATSVRAPAPLIPGPLPPNGWPARCLSLLLLFILSQGFASQVSFRREIAPILQAKCVACHGPDESKGGYRLDSFERLLTPGDSGDKPILAGQPESSLLLQLIASQDPDERMPQKDDPLPAHLLNLFRAWIEQGATFDGDDPQANLAALFLASRHPAAPEHYPFPAPITALAFHPDGTELAASGIHEVTVWNPADGSLLRRLTNIAERIMDLAYHPNGQLLAVAGGDAGRLGEVRLIHPQSGNLSQVLAHSSDLCLAVAFSPQGDLLATGGTDATAQIFSPTNPLPLRIFDQHADWVLQVQFSPDGSRLATACRDGSARVYRLDEGTLETSYLGHGKPVFSVAFTPDSSHVLSGGADGEIHLWNVADGNKTSEIKGLSGPPLDLLVQGDDVWTGGQDGQVRLYHFRPKPAKVRIMPGHRDVIYSMALHPGRKRVATGSYDGMVQVYPLEGEEAPWQFLAAPGQAKPPPPP